MPTVMNITLTTKQNLMWPYLLLHLLFQHYSPLRLALASLTTHTNLFCPKLLFSIPLPPTSSSPIRYHPSTFVQVFLIFSPSYWLAFQLFLYCRFTVHSYTMPKPFRFTYGNYSYSIGRFTFIINLLIHVYSSVAISICWPIHFFSFLVSLRLFPTYPLGPMIGYHWYCYCFMETYS